MKKIVVCGLSNRALKMFIEPILTRFYHENQVVGLLDFDARRHEICVETYPELAGVGFYTPEQFEQMVKETGATTVIVTSRDDTHVDYILRGLALNLDIISEKPMVTTSEDARRVLEAEQNSKGKVTVAFNYRYSPYHIKIKELIQSGKIGKVTSIDLNWYIDTYHGSSYFKRWNRERAFSGGLSVHKSTHHFDLVNWWIDQQPEEVFAFGDLHYYGQESELNPSPRDGRHCGTCSEQQNCSYYRRWFGRSDTTAAKDDHLMAGQDLGAYTNYRPDSCIFDSEIEIEDTYVATVKYNKGALLSYSINFSVPYEGYRLAINGTKGRIETQEYHAPSRTPFPVPEQTIDFIPLFGSKEIIHVVKNEGGHGGGDPLIQEDIFLGPDPARPYEVLAGAEAGTYSIAVGEAVWKSTKSGQPIKIKSLLTEKEEV
ncbi:oxidoreductase [Alkalihalobacillus alcalophilus ATCC 27647 = CGMCC 1.3604]|uniref:Oxidoreductase n=1 Tax=Alkalihalobacillus alcalophilus ATCC 27647 = CGMCC 1.3604 TaxID=1218173 RepID=A0A094WN85_ALKAL|nr:Gfo/Idh/MocA family oxidoreductase [Alkalihalobacillus alcalophilus]KGA97438.1 oxidoreductase [Alkalihalobacillus alcalophilus ATCC 27647 = CGMCC 1.3604]MED1562242.1 Gfo/Idh/MocA family oxidoreductase [Alkalihalobacillus alcalophilus]THG90828.1 oxidoreductase [Alkalihalobacillus alcalophilus ATCC 27647 = CGMCC 1.3604]